MAFNTTALSQYLDSHALQVGIGLCISFIIQFIVFSQIFAFKKNASQSTTSDGNGKKLSKAGKQSSNEKYAHLEKKFEKKKKFTLRVPNFKHCLKTNRSEYTIEFKYKDHVWHVHRKYNDFMEFVTKYPPPETSKAKVPPKSSLLEWTFGWDKQAVFLENRRAMLEKLLKDTLHSDSAFEAAALNDLYKSFLGVPEDVDLSDVSIGPDRKKVLDDGFKSFRVSLDHMSKATGEGIAPWSRRNVTNDGIATYLFEDGDFVHVMIQGPVQAKANETLDFVTDVNIRKQWDELFNKESVLEAYDLTNEEKNALSDIGYEVVDAKIFHTCVDSPAKMLVSERDSVTIGIIGRRLKDNAYVLAFKSVDDKRAPPPGSGGFIRVEVDCMAFMLEPKENNTCLFTSVSLVDPKAYVPPFLIKSLAPQRALMLRVIGPKAAERAKTTTIKYQ